MSTIVKIHTNIWLYFRKVPFIPGSLFVLIFACFISVFLQIFLLLPTISNTHAATFQMQTGYYVGTGANLSITGLGFQPNLVIVKADTAAGVGAVWTSSAMTSTNSNYFTATAKNTASQITLNSDGFTVSSSANVNTAGVRWTWVAFGGSDSSSTGTFCVGSYTGNGSASRSIASVGFQPDLVWVKAETAQNAVWRSSAMGNNIAQYFINGAQITNGSAFKTLDSTGFSIGNSATVNSNGVVYQYIAFKGVSGAMSVGSYTGNEVDNRNITGVGFSPDFVFVKNATSSYYAVFNLTESYEDYSGYFSDIANAVNNIQLLQSDGFQVGSNTYVNNSGNTIYWVAFGGAVDPTPSGAFKMARGSYSGNGTSQSVTGLGFTPDLVIIKHTDQATDQYAVFRTRMMGGANATAYLAAATANFANGITSLNSDGFSVGAHATVNTSGDTYYWEAFGNAFNPLTNSGAVNFAIGAYMANEIDSRNISRIGFQPDFVTIKASGAYVSAWRTSVLSGDLSSFFGATAEAADNIQALNTDGFQLGLANQVSVAGALYWWFAFKSGSNFSVNTYSGTGAAQDITTVGFQPDLVWVKRSTAVNGVFRSSSLSGNSTQYFANVANVSNRITGFISNGFSVGGSQTETNVNGGAYRYAAWKIPSTVTITATDANASEAGTDTGIFTITRSSENISTSLTVNYAVSGTATSGSDYDSIGSSVTIPALSTSATITVTPIDDATDEPPETVIVTLSASSDYNVGAPGSATVTIADDDPPSVTITSSDPNASETGPDPATFTITRTDGDTSSDLTVNYTVSGTAVSGSDYNSIGNSATIAASFTTATITVTPIDDGIDELTETVIVTLETGSGYTIGAPDNATVNITDDSFTPTVQFTSSSQSRAENVGTTSVTAQLSAVSGLDVTLPFTLSGTAVNNDDYTITASPLTIAAGTTTATITVTVVDDTSDEDDETIIISMGTPTNATATSPTEHTITINDDDLPQPQPQTTPVIETFTINSTSPSDGATNVSIDTTVSAAFSMLINGQTPTTDTFYIMNDGTKISGSVKTEGDTITFTPSTSLDYNTTYTATITKDVQAANYAGTTLDSEYTWGLTTLKFQAPSASTESATNITSSAANLNGIVNANGLSTTAWFGYGTTSGSYDSLSSTQDVSGLNDTTLGISINDLSAGTNYYYRIVAQNSAGATYGNEMTFTTTDTTPPDCSVSVNNGDSYTSSATVTLSLSATDNVGITGYFVSTNSFIPSVSDSKWISITSSTNFTDSISYTLSEGDGNKTVYVWYKDDAGNVSDYASDSIVLDTTAPTVIIEKSSFITSNNSITMKLKGSASDNLSGITGVAWSNNLGGNGTATGTTSWTISNIDLFSGENIITVTAIDNANNRGSDIITVTSDKNNTDTTPIVTPTPSISPVPSLVPTLIVTPSPIETPTLAPIPSPITSPAAEGKIYGYVKDKKDEPVGNARLRLIGRKKALKTKSFDTDGFFEFSDVEPGKYKILVKKKGFKRTRKNMSLREKEEKKVEIYMREREETEKSLIGSIEKGLH